MKITRGNLNDAEADGVLGDGQADRLWTYLGERTQDVPGFRATHILYYFGGLIAIGAMTLFMTLGWESFGGWGLFVIALVYAAAGIALTEYFLRGKHLTVPAGITATFVVALTPLAVYGLQTALGYWIDGRIYRDYHVYIDGRWIFMELATLAAGAIMLWRYRLPFLLMPVAGTLWYMSMDLAPLLAAPELPVWEIRKFVSLWFGLATILLGFWVDIRTRKTRDFAFWLYLFGVLAFWGGLSLMDSSSEFSKFLYLCVNLIMIATGGILCRKVFVVFGALGTTGYLGHLAYNVFEDSMLFPFVLTLIGLGIIGLGILWQRHERAIGEHLRKILPTALRELLERRF